MGFSLILKLIFSTGKTAEAGCPGIEIEEESMLKSRKIIFKFFTIVELLAVLAIFGILLAASLKSFPMLFGKQGLVGSVRTLSSKVSMARSYAVIQNRNVAVLIPDKLKDALNSYYCSGTEITPYIYNFSRLCYVDSNNKFDGWIDGEDWSPFANGVCAYIESPVTQAAPIPPPPPSPPFPPPASVYTIQKITNIPGAVIGSCSAVVFQSNGTLMNAGNVVIRVNSAFYDKDTGDLTFNVGSSNTNEQKRLKRWNILINSFTGKVKYVYGTND